MTSSSTTVRLTDRPILLALVVFVVALMLYTLTLAPGLLWGGGDFATFQTLAYSGHPETDTGVFAHPLWVILAHPFMLIPIRDAAWRANFATAVLGAAAVGFVFFASQSLTRSTAASLLGAAALAVSHTFWTYAVMPKVYSLNALLLMICFCLLLWWREKGRDGYLYLSTLLYGLSFTNHIVMSTVAAGFATFIFMVLWPQRMSKRIGPILLGACCSFALGLTPYLVMLLAARTGQAVGGTAFGFVVGLWRVLSQPLLLLKGLGWAVALGAYQFPITGVVGLAGIYFLWQRDRAAAGLILMSVLGTLAFLLGALDPGAGSVYVWNLHYYLLAYVILAPAIAVGFQGLWARLPTHTLYGQAAIVGITVAVPIVLYAVAPTVARTFWQNVPDFRILPGRDNMTYVLSPWKNNETGAREFGERILQTLPPTSTLFADYSIWAVIRYLQVVEQARPDVTLVQLTTDQVATVLKYRDRSNLYLADTYRYYDVKGIQEYFDITASGPIYRLVPK